MTWTLLIWTAQAAFDLFVWVLLILLVVAGGYHRRALTTLLMTGDHRPVDQYHPRVVLTTIQGG